MIHNINFYPGIGVSIRYLDDENFITIRGTGGDIKIKDDDLKPNKEGKVIVNIEKLDLNRYYAIEIPKEIEIPVELLEEREKLKRLGIFGKTPIGTDFSHNPCIEFYFDEYRLQIVQADKVTFAEKIENIHGRRAINIEALGLDHPYIEPSEKVTEAFEEVLRKKAESEAYLSLVGENLLNGKMYYRLSADISPYQFNLVRNKFELFNSDNDDFKGYLTCEPDYVSQVLGIPIN